MVLNMPNIFQYGGLFRISPEDNQGLLFQGNRNLPGSISGADGTDGADGESGAGFTFIIQDTFDSMPSAPDWAQFTSGGSISAGSGVLGIEANDVSGNNAGVIGLTSTSTSTTPYLVCEFTSSWASQGLSGAASRTKQFIGLSNQEAVEILDDNCIGLYWDGGAASEVRLMCISGGAFTSGAIGIGGQFSIHTSIYNTHRIEVNAGEVTHYLNGVSSATIKTNITEQSLKAFIRSDCVDTDIYGLPGDNRVKLRDYTFWNDRN